MRALLILLLLFQIYLSQAQAQKKGEVLFSPVPHWVKLLKVDSTILDDNEDDLIKVLEEDQVNIESKEYFTREVFKINSPKGISRIGSYSFTFDPEVHAIAVHGVFLHRDDKKIDLYKEAHTELNRQKKYVGGSLYTQESKFRFFFNDLEVGDFIEIMYTKIGRQPDLDNQFVYKEVFYPYSKLRVLGKKEKKIYYKEEGNNFPKMKEKINDGSFEWIWEFSISQQKIELEKKSSYYTSPMWANDNSVLYLSSFGSFKDLQVHQRKRYSEDVKISEKITRTVTQLTDSLKTKEEKVNAIFQFIQKEINYLEYGYSTPTLPDTVLKQKFGDCKSMSFLTTKMLNVLGIEGHPFIVNINGFNLASKGFYTPQSFNHCIVEFKLDDDYSYFDPTFDYQGGLASNKYLYNYNYGLSVREGITDYVVAKKASVDKIVSKDLFVFNEQSDKVQLKRALILSGKWADKARNLYTKGGLDYATRNLKGNIYSPSSSYINYSGIDSTYNETYRDKLNSNQVFFKSDIELEESPFSYDTKDWDKEIKEHSIDVSFLYEDDFNELEDEDSTSTQIYFGLPYPFNFRHEVMIAGMEDNSFNLKNISIDSDFMSFSKKTEKLEFGVKYIFEIKTKQDFFEKKGLEKYHEIYNLMEEYCKISMIKK
jgi:transglutaminase-like putative cysteine protease